MILFETTVFALARRFSVPVEKQAADLMRGLDYEYGAGGWSGFCRLDSPHE
jgi:hypothetical protein